MQYGKSKTEGIVLLIGKWTKEKMDKMDIKIIDRENNIQAGIKHKVLFSEDVK